jgi:hypothetical protein
MTGTSVTSGSAFHSACSMAVRSDTTSIRSFRTALNSGAGDGNDASVADSESVWSYVTAEEITAPMEQE